MLKIQRAGSIKLSHSAVGVSRGVFQLKGQEVEGAGEAMTATPEEVIGVRTKGAEEARENKQGVSSCAQREAKTKGGARRGP